MTSSRKKLLFAASALLVLGIAAALYFALRENGALKTADGYSGVRGVTRDVTIEESSPALKTSLVIHADESFIRDKRILKIARFAGEKETVLQGVTATMTREGKTIATATAARGVYYPKTGAARLEQGVKIQIGPISIDCGMADFKKDGQLSVKGEYEAKNAEGKTAKGKLYSGRPEDFKMP